MNINLNTALTTKKISIITLFFIIMQCTAPFKIYADNNYSINSNYGESKILCENDLKFLNPDELIINETFEGDNPYGLFSYTRYLSTAQIDTQHGTSLELTPGSDRSALATITLPNEITDGIYKLSFNMYVPDANSCYQYIQITDNAGTSANTFGTVPLQNGKYKAGALKGWYSFDKFAELSQNMWTDVKLLINADKKYIDYYINGEFICKRQFQLTNISKISFYRQYSASADEADVLSPVYIDGLLFEQIPFIDNFSGFDSGLTAFGTTTNAAYEKVDGIDFIKFAPSETALDGSTSYNFSTPLANGTYKLSFYTQIPDGRYCGSYIDFRASDGEYYNTFYIKGESQTNARMGFYHTKRLWSQSPYYKDMSIDTLYRVDMLLDLDLGKVTYYINGEKLKSCVYEGLENAELTSFYIRYNSGLSQYTDSVLQTDTGIKFADMSIEKFYGKYADDFFADGYDIDTKCTSNELRFEMITDSAGNILFDDSNIKLAAINRSNNTLDGNIKITAKDENGEQYTLLNTQSKVFSANGICEIPLDFSGLKYGIYNLFVTYNNNTVSPLNNVFSVCRNAEGVYNPKLGLNNHLSRVHDFSIQNGDVAAIGKLMKRGGYSVSRSGLDAQNVVSDNGRYVSFTVDTERESAYRAATLGNGIEVMQLLTNGGYSSEASPPVTDDEIANFADYVYDMVSMYKDSVEYWEVWNEYNLASFNKYIKSNYSSDEERTQVQNTAAANYAKLLKAVYTSAKSADPNCKIIAFAAAIGRSSTAWKGIDFIDDVLKIDSETKNYFDICSYHYYDSMSANGETSGFADTMQSLRDVLNSNGCADKPIWLTEMGYSTGNYTNKAYSVGVDYKNQANYLIKNLLSNDAHSFADMVMLYGLTDKWRSDVYENGFGLTKTVKDGETPFLAKPSYLALANWNYMFGGAVFNNLSYDASGQCAMYQYTANDGDGLAALFNTNVQNQTVSIYTGSQSVTVYDIYGNAQTVECDGGVLDLVLNDSVKYIKGNFEPLEFTGAFGGGYAEIFRDDFKNYTGGNREFYTNIQSGVPYILNGDTYLLTNDELSASRTKRINLRQNVLGNNDKTKVTFDFTVPETYKEFNGEVHFKLRDDVKISTQTLDTSEKKNSAWTMFLRINPNKVSIYKTGGAYVTDYSERSSIPLTLGTKYSVTLDVDFGTNSYTVSVTDGVNTIESTVNNLTQTAFDMLEIVETGQNSNFNIKYAITNLSVKKYINEVNVQDWTAVFKNKDGSPINTADDILSSEIYANSYMTNAAFLKKGGTHILICVYNKNELYSVKDINKYFSSPVKIDIPNDLKNIKINTYIWAGLIPLDEYKTIAN